jgi:hypothetical protein
MKSPETRSEVSSPKNLGRSVGPKKAILFAATAFLLGVSAYMGERATRANPEWIPVKAQIRSFANAAGEAFHPVSDPDVGFLGPPHLQGRVSTEDYEYLQETDAHGFRNGTPWSKTADIVILGDSLLEGAGVGLDGQFSTLVSRSLPMKRIVNLGLGGAAPNRQFRIFRKFGASLRPRLVVACIYLASDLDGQLVFDAWLKEGAKSDYNQFRLKFGDGLHPRSFWTGVQRKSYLIGKLTELSLRWWGIPERISFLSGPDVLLDIESLRSLARELDRRDPRLLSMIESLKEMQALSQSDGASFLVLLIPSKEEIYGAPFIPEVAKPGHILEERLKEEGFSVLSTYDAVRERGKHQSTFFTHDIHLTALGNQIVSDSLVNWIKHAGVFRS